MIRLAVFDIDGTLAATEEVIESGVSLRLRGIEEQGVKIILISGRTASYLAGLARGIGLKSPLVAGENGGVIFDPISHWETRLEAIPAEIATQMQKMITERFNGSIWFQPNQTMVTAAPHDLSRIDEVYQIIIGLPQIDRCQLKINRYNDAIEIMPKNNSKGLALAKMKERLLVSKEEVVVFGNTLVDLPMSPEAKEFLLIGHEFSQQGIQHFEQIESALDSFEERYL